MILSVRVNNFLVYSNDVEFSLKADMRIKKFACNVFQNHHYRVLKSACIYGANNSGKTCLLRAINSIKCVLLGIVAEVTPNLFTDSSSASFGITFLSGERAFSYDYKFDSGRVNGYKKGFVYECLKELFVDNHGNRSEQEIFIRDVQNGIYRFRENAELSRLLGVVSNNNILIYTLNTEKYPIVETYKTILREFAMKVDMIDMNNIPLSRTIQVLKNNEKIRDKTVELIKLADIDIDDYKYLKNIPQKEEKGAEEETGPREIAIRATIAWDDVFRLTSVHKGKAVRSLEFDSTGTKKIVAIASYIIDALTNGRILVIDELDSSLHSKLTRAIVSLFNNDANTQAQLIFTAHDVTLLDCKRLFRKDQIWFAAKDRDNEYLYSLADFTSLKDNVRSESDLIEKYNAGVFGAIPEPDLISVMFSEEP